MKVAGLELPSVSGLVKFVIMFAAAMFLLKFLPENVKQFFRI